MNTKEIINKITIIKQLIKTNNPELAIFNCDLLMSDLANELYKTENKNNITTLLKD